MENAKIKKLEPKEWLDRVIDNLDQLRILDRALRPEEVVSTCLDVTDYESEFPTLHLGAENVRFFGTLFNLPIELSTVHYCLDTLIHNYQQEGGTEYVSTRDGSTTAD